MKRNLFIFVLYTIVIIFLFATYALSDELCSSIIEQSLTKWAEVRDYQCQMYTYNRLGKIEDERVYEYKFMKPNYVYMKILKGRSKGAKVFYNPETNKVRGCKKVIFTLCRTFDPSAKKVTSIRGVKVYETSFGYILNIAKSYIEKGASCSVHEDRGFKVLTLKVDNPIYQDVVKEKLYFDNTGFPVMWERFAKDGLVYKLKCSDVKINTGLTISDFKP